MKTILPFPTRLTHGPLGSGAVVALGLAIASLGLSAIPARAQEAQLDVGVRSDVVDTSAMRADKSATPNAGEHSKLYGILSVKQVTSEEKLVRPVNENMIMQLLSYELNTHGYHLYAPGQKPDIILTVVYGRGFLLNPYQLDDGKTETPGLANEIGQSKEGGHISAPTITMTSNDFTTQFAKEKSNGYEGKMQKAGYEKLYIRVAAWAYPTDPKVKTRQLWNTTMIVDDPDHRDLNAVAEKMLEAGVNYFDRQIKDPEVDVYQPLPDGKVNVGQPEVVEPAAAKSK